MDLTSLACFVTATDTLNFRAAAGRQALSPAAFSDRIRRLEEDLDQQLFARTTRRTALTDAGRRLLPHARQLLADAERCHAIAADDDARAPFELTLGTRFELGLSWLVPALGALERQRPERTLHLLMGDTPELVRRLDRGEIDAFVSSARLTSPRLTWVPLHEETYAFVGTADTVHGPEDAARLTLLDVDASLPLFRYLLDALPAGPPWRFARHNHLGGIAGIRARLLEGAGVAVLPTYFVRDDLEAGRLVRLLPDVHLRSDTFRLVWRDGHHRADALREVGEALRERPLR